MDYCGTLLIGTLGGLVGYYVGSRGPVAIASRAIDLYIDAKWYLIDLISPATDAHNFSPEKPIEPEEDVSPVIWHKETEHYKIYELNGKVYLTFNTEYKPALHLEDDSIDTVTVILKDGTRTKPSDNLIKLLVMCAGHGCSYKSGVPTLEQLKKFDCAEELDQVKKIIINTVQFEEHIIEGQLH